jgi:hypothetical protein
VVLGAAGELLAAADEGVIAVNWWLLPGGIEPGLRFPLEQSIYWSERLVSIAGAVLIGFALTQARTRPVPRRAWPWIGGCLLAHLGVVVDKGEKFANFTDLRLVEVDNRPVVHG